MIAQTIPGTEYWVVMVFFALLGNAVGIVACICSVVKVKTHTVAALAVMSALCGLANLVFTFQGWGYSVPGLCMAIQEHPMTFFLANLLPLLLATVSLLVRLWAGGGRGEREDLGS